ncbi:MAG: lipid kinase YegS [Planctomycetota bacterium]
MSTESKRWLRLVVNGKAAGDPMLRPAVKEIRDAGHRLDVRVTWEAGDAARMAGEAVSEGVDVVVAGGGDGTINEVATGMLANGNTGQSAMAVLPYGTANDFATSTGVLKGDPLSALKLAASGPATAIDVGQVNDRLFVNVTSGGFGAEVTANTPPQMKKALGGAAYSLMGIVTAAKMNPYECKFTGPDNSIKEAKLLVLAVGNGIQCGGGYRVTPDALLNDGMLDVTVIHDAELSQLGLVLSELSNLSEPSNRFVTSRRVSSFKLESQQPLQLNLDGEPYRDTHFEFKVLPAALRFVLGPDAPLQV